MMNENQFIIQRSSFIIPKETLAMWTPRRVALLLFGIVLFFGCYFGYGRSQLGAIDGLPTLPDDFRPRPDTGEWDRPLTRESRVVGKLKQAFGLECEELKRSIKLELN